MQDEKIFDYSKNIAELIKQSEAYKNYLFFKEKVKSDPNLQGEIIELKKEQANIEYKKINGEEVSFEDERKINSLYSQIAAWEGGYEFLESEKLLLKLISDVYEKISTDLDIDFSFYN